jgi:predicted ATP-dependent serine protease
MLKDSSCDRYINKKKRKKTKGSMRHIKDSINLISGRNQLPMPFGMKYLDKNLGGLYPGELTVICGNPDC